MKHLVKLQDNVNFILVGEGSCNDRLKKLVESSHLHNRVIFTGRQEGIILKELYKLADIFIFPSLYDQFGYVVIEALASGLPVLCSKYAGASCFIKDSLNGFLIDPYGDYSQEILKILSNIDIMKKNAAESIKKFTLEHRVKEFIEIFNKIAVKKQ